MLSSDGLFFVVEGRAGGELGKREGKENRGNEGKGEWWTNGVIVSVWLRRDVMGRLMLVRELRAFRI